jgi:hypothetical protein
MKTMIFKQLILLFLLSLSLYSQEKKKEVLVVGDGNSVINFSFVHQTFDTQYVNITFIADLNKTTGWAIVDLKWNTIKYYDLIIVFIGMNDIENAISHYVIIKNYDEILTLCSMKSRNIIAITIPYIRSSIKFDKEEYLETYFVNEYILNSTQVTAIDINDVFNSYSNQKTLFLPDGIHLSPLAHSIIKDLIINELVKD